MTFADLVKVQPRLAQLQKDARDWEDEDSPAMYDKYQNLKDRLTRLVGWKAAKGLPEFMYTSEAYDIAHKAIFG